MLSQQDFSAGRSSGGGKGINDESFMETLNVLVSLIDNARQADARRVTLHAQSDGEAITIEIADDGPGIPVADRERIFEPFFTSRRTAGGTGLGLPIVRSLLSSANGTIKLGEAELGSRFILRLRSSS